MCRKVAGAELTVRVTIVTGVQSRAHGFKRDYKVAVAFKDAQLLFLLLNPLL